MPRVHHLTSARVARALHRTRSVMLVLGWCALIALRASGDPTRYRFNVWTTENGLPQNSVRAILQTRDGYLWLATLDGLVRYDGVRFTIFNTVNSSGLKSNRISRLFEDDDGTLWVGTEDSGVICYHQGSFTTYTTRDGLPNNAIWGIQDDGAGGVIVATAGGVARWRSGQFTPFVSDAPMPVSGIGYHGQTRLLWYTDASTLHVLKHGKPLAFKPQDGLASLKVVSMYEDRQGALWIGTSDTGLCRFKDGRFQVFTQKDGLPASEIIAFFEDREGALWIGTGSKGLVRFKDGQFKTYTTADGLSENIVLSIYEDREGNIWVGTLNGGLNRLNKQLIMTLSTKDGLAANNIYPIFEDHAGDIWIGNWEMGLSRYSQGKLTRYKNEDAPPGKVVTAIAEDREGRIWIGEYGGVSYFKDGKFIPFLLPIGLQKGALISAIYQDREGAMWFGSDQGLRRYKDGALQVYTTADGLAGNDVRAITEDRQGNLWAGTFSGLTRLKDGVLTSYTTRDGMGGNYVRALYEDAEGVVWIGTYDGGLTRFKDGRFTAYTTREGLFNNGVFQILEDGRGNFWMSCNLGIYRVSRQQLTDFAEGKLRAITCIPYGRQDGMLNIECNGGMQSAGIRTRDGKLWFPTQEGVAIIDPASVPLNSEPPPVILEEILVDRVATDWQHGADRFEVGPDRESIEIHYTGLSFIKPEYVSFRYRLEGLDHDWVDAGTRRAVYYSHLPPGDYTFQVIAANSDGVWNTTGASIQIRVIPPFWRTWWFAGLAVMAALAIAFAINERRLARLKKAHAAQEAFSRQLIASQEQERKRIAAELHDSLGQNLLIIKNWALLGLSATDESAGGKQELHEISDTVSQSIDEVREIAYNLRPYQLDEIGLTRTVQAMLRKVASASGIHFSVELDPVDGLFSKEDEINFYRILQECVNNIVKHAQATVATVTIRREAQMIAVTIEDNGKGFAVDAPPAAAGKKGFGLTGIAERARMLGGQQLIHSTAGQGTVVSLMIPCDQTSRGDANGK